VMNSLCQSISFFQSFVQSNTDTWIEIRWKLFDVIPSVAIKWCIVRYVEESFWYLEIHWI